MLWTRTHTGLFHFPLPLTTRPSLGTLSRPASQIHHGPMWHVPPETPVTYRGRYGSRRHDRPCHQQAASSSPNPIHRLIRLAQQAHVTRENKSQASSNPVLSRLVPPRQSSSRRCGYTKLRQTGLINWGVNGTAQTDNANNPTLFSRATAASKTGQTGKSLPRTSQQKKGTIVPYHANRQTDYQPTGTRGGGKRKRTPPPFLCNNRPASCHERHTLAPTCLVCTSAAPLQKHDDRTGRDLRSLASA